MALQVPIINDDDNIEYNYHRILGFIMNFDVPDGQLQINVLSYINKEARDHEKAWPHLPIGILIRQPLLEYADDNFTRENLYNRLKNEDERFAEAIDC